MDDLELELIETNRLIAGRQLPESIDHQAANRVELFIAERGTKEFIEFIDGRECLDHERVVINRANQLPFFDIGLVFDFTHNFLEHVLDSNQARNTAVLVDHDRHVVAVLPELSQQHVEPLALRDSNYRPHEFFNTWHITVTLNQRQQVLGEQHADDIVDTITNDRVARVARLDNFGQRFLKRLIGINHNHLRAGDHDVAHLHVGHEQCALHDFARVLIDDLVLFSEREHAFQIGFVLGFATDEMRQSVQPGSFF